MESFVKGFKTIIGDVEMVPYKVIADRGEYEERMYPPKKWVQTSMESIDRSDALSFMFRLLFNYISGKNQPNIRIDMTTPVTTKIEPGQSATCESKFTMSFYVPKDHQDNPPVPADSKISIENRPQLKVFARRFGGFVSDEVMMKQVEALAEALKRAGETDIDLHTFYLVGYDPPYKPINRRNEIWYTKEVNSDTISLETP